MVRGQKPSCNFLGNKKTAGLLRLGFGLSERRRLAKHDGVQLVPRDLAVKLGFHLAATFTGDIALSLPFLDGLGAKPDESAERGLISCQANGFGDSGFHSSVCW